MFLKKPFWKEVACFIRDRSVRKKLLNINEASNSGRSVSKSRLYECNTSAGMRTRQGTQKALQLLQNKAAIELNQNK